MDNEQRTESRSIRSKSHADEYAGEFFVASCDKSGGIHHFSLDSFGKLAHLSFTPCDRPMYMICQGRELCALLRCPCEDSGKNESALVRYSLDAGNMPGEIKEVSFTNGDVACHLACDGKDIYVTNYRSGSVVRMPDKLVIHKGRGSENPRQDKPHPHSVAFSPDGKYVLAADLGLDCIFVYDKEMMLCSSAKVPHCHGARMMCFSECGRYLFVVNELASTLSVFSYSPGKLELLETASTLPPNFSGANTAAAIRVKNGKIYVSNRGQDTISRLSFDGKNIKLEKSFPCGGRAPRDFDFVGEYVVCTNQFSDNITVLAPAYRYGEAEPFDYEAVDSYAVKTPICIAKIQ